MALDSTVTAETAQISVPQSDRVSGPVAVLAAPVPDLPAAAACEVLRAVYGLAGTASPLRSERDQNFLVEADGARFVLKLNNVAQDPGVALFQIRALLHVARVDPELPVPRMIPTLEGAWAFDWPLDRPSIRSGRLVTYLSGAPLAGHRGSRHQAENVGRFAARLGRALRGFFDPAAGHELLWDLKHAAHAADFLSFVHDPRDRRLAEQAVDQFLRHVEPRLPGLRAQVIHNDLNPHNVLVNPSHPDTPSGIIDFGDLVHGALVNDVAIAAAYLLGGEADPLADVCRFVSGYHAVTPLEPEEIALLPDLIATRHALTCAISAWRAGRNPDNAAYIVRNRGAATHGIEILADLGRDAVAARFRAACGLG